MFLKVFTSLLLSSALTSATIMHNNAPLHVFLEKLFGKYHNIQPSLDKAYKSALAELKESGYILQDKPASYQNKNKVKFYVITKQNSRPIRIKNVISPHKKQFVARVTIKKPSKAAARILTNTKLTQSILKDPSNRPITKFLQAHSPQAPQMFLYLGPKFIPLFHSSQQKQQMLLPYFNQGHLSTITNQPSFWCLDGLSFSVKVPLIKDGKYGHCICSFRAYLKDSGYYKIKLKKRSPFYKDR